MSALQDLSYQLSHERGDVQLVIANPAALLHGERELTFRVSREQVRELAAAFAEMDEAFERQEADDRARQSGMSFGQRCALRMQLIAERKQAERDLFA